MPQRNDPDSIMASEPTLSSLAALAGSSSESSSMHATPGPSGEKYQTKEQQRRHFVRTLHKVIEESDVVILVLDARDPEGTRSRLVEEEVRRRESEGKRLVFVLNKVGECTRQTERHCCSWFWLLLLLSAVCVSGTHKSDIFIVDLVPQTNAQAWLRYLRHTTPTLPFRSVSSSSNPSSATAPALLKLLKAYRPSGKQSITIGVVGYPTVGKSSLVNALKRSKVSTHATFSLRPTILKDV